MGQQLTKTVDGSTPIGSSKLPEIPSVPQMPSLEPHGIELRLTGVPINVSARALKAALANEHFQKGDYDFLVVLEKSSEELFWQKFDESRNDRTITARVIIPNSFGSDNIGKALIGRTISLRCGKTSFEVQAKRIRNPETMNHKYDELRRTKLNVSPAAGIQNGTIGFIRRVSCGMFDQDNKFETTYAWACDQGRNFKDFSYFGDV
jgi:hypothetical protein